MVRFKVATVFTSLTKVFDAFKDGMETTKISYIFITVIVTGKYLPDF